MERGKERDTGETERDKQKKREGKQDLKKKSEYNSFAMLCWFLPYNIMNQPYVYIYSLPLEPPSHPVSPL